MDYKSEEGETKRTVLGCKRSLRQGRMDRRGRSGPNISLFLYVTCESTYSGFTSLNSSRLHTERRYRVTIWYMYGQCEST